MRAFDRGAGLLCLPLLSDVLIRLVYCVGNCPMNKTTSLVGALSAFGALAYLMAPLPPETPPARAVAAASTEIAAGTVLDRASEDPSSAAVRVLPPPAAPKDPATLLVRQLQTELLRLGCYDGAIDGQWSAETRDAMHGLGERVRVLRPVDTPDYIMLALARSQESHICVPHGKATAARQPARLVPMAGLVPNTVPLAASNERARRTSSPTRSAEPMPAATAQSAPPRAAARKDVGIVMGPSVRPSSEAPRTEAIQLADRASLEQSRMSLGGAAAAPHDPTAPAPYAATAGVEPEMAEMVEPRTVLRPAPARAPTSAPSRSQRRAWTRTFFSEMDKNGP